jgi:hypothetical protein
MKEETKSLFFLNDNPQKSEDFTFNEKLRE